MIPSLDVAYAEYARYIMNGMMTQLARIEPGIIRHIMKYRNRKHQDTFFSGAKQDTCDVYPYWPSSSLSSCSAASA